jgi:hypothetical protein
MCWTKRLFHYRKHVRNVRLLTFNSTPCDSTSVSVISSNLCSFNFMLVFGKRKKLQGSCRSVGIVLQVLAHRNSGLYLAMFQQTKHEFCSSPHRLLFNPRLRCVSKQRMTEFYKNRKSYVICHHGCQETPFPNCMAHLTTGEVNIQHIQKKFGHFWKVNNIQRSMLCSWFHHYKVILKKWPKFQKPF